LASAKRAASRRVPADAKMITTRAQGTQTHDGLAQAGAAGELREDYAQPNDRAGQIELLCM
jgi:hypothetical protein